MKKEPKRPVGRPPLGPPEPIGPESEVVKTLFAPRKPLPR